MRKFVFVAAALAAVLVGVPAGATARATAVVPSSSAKMICSSEGQKDIAANLGGVKPAVVTAPTWSGDVYSCTYAYTSGTIALSVKELGTRRATTSYVATLARVLGRRADKLPLGQGAFWTTNGSVVVRKDTKVLLVDTSHLTAELGVPPEKASGSQSTSPWLSLAAGPANSSRSASTDRATYARRPESSDWFAAPTPRRKGVRALEIPTSDRERSRSAVRLRPSAGSALVLSGRVGVVLCACWLGFPGGVWLGVASGDEDGGDGVGGDEPERGDAERGAW